MYVCGVLFKMGCSRGVRKKIQVDWIVIISLFTFNSVKIRGEIEALMGIFPITLMEPGFQPTALPTL